MSNTELVVYRGIQYTRDRLPADAVMAEVETLDEWRRNHRISKGSKPKAKAAAEPSAPAGDSTTTPELFDPAAHKVDDVVAYLVDADEAERARVITAEAAAAKPRKGIIEWAPAPAGDATTTG